MLTNSLELELVEVELVNGILEVAFEDIQVKEVEPSTCVLFLKFEFHL